jgi:hypothetical protein
MPLHFQEHLYLSIIYTVPFPKDLSQVFISQKVAHKG